MSEKSLQTRIVDTLITGIVSSAVAGLIVFGRDHFAIVALAEGVSDLKAAQSQYIKKDVYVADMNNVNGKLDLLLKNFRLKYEEPK